MDKSIGSRLQSVFEFNSECLRAARYYTMIPGRKMLQLYLQTS